MKVFSEGQIGWIAKFMKEKHKMFSYKQMLETTVGFGISNGMCLVLDLRALR